LKNIKKRFGFTMVEMIFVIVILGIVAAIGSGIIAKIYESYIYSQSINSLQTKTELAIDQIAKYLSYSIKDSIIARKSPTKFKQLSDANGSYQILEWIGYNNEGFEGNKTGPGWSGFVDLDSPDTNNTQIDTPGSHLSYAKQVISALSNNEVNLSSPNSSAGIVFSGLPNDFNVSQYGWNNGSTEQHDYIFRVQRSGQDVLKFIENNATTVYEHYQLVWSAYAIVPEGNTSDRNLTFYYNFRPWMGKTYKDGSKTILMEHVSTFRFRQVGNAIRLKLCVFNPVGNDFNITFCKEKVVF